MVLDTLVWIEELCASLLKGNAELMLEFVSLTQKVSRTLTGGAVHDGAKCSGCYPQSVHAGEVMEALCKPNLLVSEAKISPYLTKLVFLSNDMIHASMVQPESPLFLPCLIRVCES